MRMNSSLILVVMLSSQLWSFNLFQTPDHQPVSMRTQKYTVAVGKFSSIADCEAYRARSPRPFVDANGVFTLFLEDSNGFGIQFLLRETNTYPPPVGTFYVQGCA